MNRPTSKLNPTDATDECHTDIFKSDSLKVPKLLLLIGNIYKTKFVCSLFVGIRFCRPDCLVLFVSSSSVATFLVYEQMKRIYRLLHWLLNLQKRSLHRVMISLIIHFSVSESCLILAKMSSKQANSPSPINTLKIPS